MKYYIEAIKLMFKNKKILILSLFPMFLSIILFYIFLNFGFTELQYYSEKLIPSSGFLKYFGIFLGVLVKFIMFIISAFIISSLANVLSAPFLSLIVREIFKSKNINEVEESNLVKEFAFVLRSQISFSILGILILILSILLFFIPFGFIVSSILTWWFLSLSYLDYSFDLKRFTFKQKIVFTQKHMALVVAMGGLINFFVLIPFVNILAISIATIGNALLFIDKIKHQ